MDDMYLIKMQKYERICNEWIQKADLEFMKNGYHHTKQECAYLQKAVEVRLEMARISLGAEQDYQKRKIRDLNAKIVEILSVVDPDYLKRKQQEAKNKKNNSDKITNVSSNTVHAANPGVDEEEVKGWFKEMPTNSFADVVGMPEVKEKLQHFIESSKLETIKAYLGLSNQKSLIFVGPPGCGKTYLINAFVHELVSGEDYKFMSLDCSNILGKYVGDAEKTVAKIFEEAEKNAPCVLFLDEIDGVCKSRSIPNLPEYASSVTTQFLIGYNRIRDLNKPIVFIGATNYPTKVDSAMMDRVEIVNISFPDEEGRIMKFKRDLSNIFQLEDGFTYADMADATRSKENPYNYRDIERLCEEIKNICLKDLMMIYESNQQIAIQSCKSGEYRLTKGLFEQAVKKCPVTPKTAIIKEISEWNEMYSKMTKA